MEKLREQEQYFVVTFPYFYSYEGNKLVLKTITYRYLSWIWTDCQVNVNLLDRNFFLASITPAIYLGNETGSDVSLYLIYLESQGMPLDKNQLFFDRRQVFSNIQDAYQTAIDLNLIYAEKFRRIFLSDLNTLEELENRAISDKFLYEFAEEVVYELTKNAIKFTVKQVIKYILTGIIVAVSEMIWKSIKRIIKVIYTAWFKKLEKLKAGGFDFTYAEKMKICNSNNLMHDSIFHSLPKNPML